MSSFEYIVIPAPIKGRKAKTARSPESRFAHALTTIMNEQARDGWEYLRTDTLPMKERKGLTGSTTSFQNMMVFRRPLSSAAASLMPPTSGELPAEPPSPALPAPEPEVDTEEKPAKPRLVATKDEGIVPPLGPARLTENDDVITSADSASDTARDEDETDQKPA